MTFPKARLVVSACLFLGWLVFLFVLWLRSSPVVLSRPQFMVAGFYVVVEVRDRKGVADADVDVTQTLWPTGTQLVPARLNLPELPGCAKSHGYQGPGAYLLPLVRLPDGEFEIAPVPSQFGYAHAPPTHGTVEAYGLFSHRMGRRLPIAAARQLNTEWIADGYHTSLYYEEIRIYPWTPDTRAQVEQLITAR